MTCAAELQRLRILLLWAIALLEIHGLDIEAAAVRERL